MHLQHLPYMLCHGILGPFHALKHLLPHKPSLLFFIWLKGDMSTWFPRASQSLKLLSHFQAPVNCTLICVTSAVVLLSFLSCRFCMLSSYTSPNSITLTYGGDTAAGLNVVCSDCLLVHSSAPVLALWDLANTNEGRERMCQAEV